jgi:hypothetical protein
VAEALAHGVVDLDGALEALKNSEGVAGPTLTLEVGKLAPLSIDT